MKPVSPTVLNGITWGHSRGITPLLAYAQRFSELNPEVDVRWKKRTLQEFADSPIEKLAEQYDLLIIDYPWVGKAAASNCVLPLEQYVSKEYLNDQQLNTVGQSHGSYNYNGHQWALAIDAATPVSSYREDLFKKNNAKLPSTWEEVLALAKSGKVAVPAIAIDILMNFYMFCIADDGEPFQNEEEVVNSEKGVLALRAMKDLYSLIDKKMFGFNPIAVAEEMTRTDNYWYCPFAYPYSNYSRVGYAENLLSYGDLVYFKPGQKLRSTIGGTGIAVSAFSNNIGLAVRFAEEIVSSKCQSSFYVQHGGQPGHKSAWINESANNLCNNFFSNILPAMERGYMRPRYNGYLHFQDHAGEYIRQYLLEGGKEEVVLNELNELYKKSLAIQFKLVL